MSVDHPLELVIDAGTEGERLDAALAAPLGSRARAQRLIDAGAVLVDGRHQPKSHLLRRGELITVQESPDDLVPNDSGAAAPYQVAYQDEHLLVIDKPAGVVVHPARGHRQGTLAQALAGQTAGGEDQGRPGIVHRLDRDTSGLLVVARSQEVHRRLKSALASRRLEREYLALVEGRPPARSGTIEAPIGRDRRVRTRMSLDSDDPREARTHFTIERSLPDTTLLRVRLETGRTHQIRVHLQAIGHQVCGDCDYGTPGRLGLTRQFLHAARLAFEHPITGAPVEVRSPLPADLVLALNRAEGGGWPAARVAHISRT